MQMTCDQHVMSVAFSGDKKAKTAYDKLHKSLNED